MGAGEYHMMIGALAVVLPVTDEYVKTLRFQVSTSLGSCSWY